jgi:hypothetical protein
MGSKYFVSYYILQKHVWINKQIPIKYVEMRKTKKNKKKNRKCAAKDLKIKHEFDSIKNGCQVLLILLEIESG